VLAGDDGELTRREPVPGEDGGRLCPFLAGLLLRTQERHVRQQPARDRDVIAERGHAGDRVQEPRFDLRVFRDDEGTRALSVRPGTQPGDSPAAALTSDSAARAVSGKVCACSVRKAVNSANCRSVACRCADNSAPNEVPVLASPRSSTEPAHLSSDALSLLSRTP
jgi:hypothetical protein